MIEINFLPRSVKTKASAKVKAIEAVGPKNLLYIVPLVLGALVCAHIYLGIVTIAKNIQLSSLNNKWQKLAPERKMLEDFRKEYAILSEDSIFAQQLTEKRVNWAEKLNNLSLSLPSGVWFNDISLAADIFTLRGSVISLQKDEVSLIKKLLDSLKNNAGFLKGFTNLEVSSVQRRVIGSYDVADFILSGSLRAAEKK